MCRIISINTVKRANYCQKQRDIQGRVQLTSVLDSDMQRQTKHSCPCRRCTHAHTAPHSHASLRQQLARQLPHHAPAFPGHSAALYCTALRCTIMPAGSPQLPLAAACPSAAAGKSLAAAGWTKAGGPAAAALQPHWSWPLPGPEVNGDGASAYMVMSAWVGSGVAPDADADAWAWASSGEMEGVMCLGAWWSWQPGRNAVGMVEFGGVIQGVVCTSGL